MTPTILYIWAGFLAIWAATLLVWLIWVLAERRHIRRLKAAMRERKP